MKDIVIRAARLSKSYRAGDSVTPVLQGVDLAISRGECVYLIGPSGSGTTTLLSILGCVLFAEADSLDLFGENALQFPPSEHVRFRREKIRVVFQRFHLFDALTAAENVYVAFDFLGWSKARSRAKALELLSLVGLEDKAANRVTRLSMGERQRVAFARALAGDPELILADEPTASLDADSGFNATQALKNLCRELRKTVVVVTHDNRIYSMADRILRLADGRIIGEDAMLSAHADRPGAAAQAEISHSA